MDPLQLAALLQSVAPLVAQPHGLVVPLGEGPASLAWFARECLPWLVPLLHDDAEEEGAPSHAEAAGTFAATVLAWHGLQASDDSLRRFAVGHSTRW
jgi:hypothetical protein